MKIVVKVGTSTLAHATGRLNIRHVEELVKVLSDLKNAGHQIILVSSGAIGMGVGKLNLPCRPTDMPGKQAAAAVGQCELMYTYDRLFTQYNHTVAQILLTGEDIDHSDRRENFQNTIFRLLELGALPIINENDTVATAEIKVGDNDTLGAVVACTVKADLLVLLSDIQGLYTADPRKDPECPADPGGGGDHCRHRGAGRRGWLRPGHGGHGHQAAGRPHGDRPGLRHDHHQRGPAPAAL